MLGGRHYLDTKEYVVFHRDISEYNQINFDVGYVTPFNIETEVRLPDIGEFKEGMLKLAQGNANFVFDYVKIFPYLYKKTRTLYKITELADLYRSLS